MQTRPILRPAIATALLLSIPLIMTIVDRGKPAGDGWHWGPLDFIVMGALVFGAGLAYELLAGRIRAKAHRAALAAALVLAVLAIWIELAVDGLGQLFRLLAG